MTRWFRRVTRRGGDKTQEPTADDRKLVVLPGPRTLGDKMQVMTMEDPEGLRMIERVIDAMIARREKETRR